MLRSDFYHCHAFVRAISELLALKQEASDARDGVADVIDTAERLLRTGRGLGSKFALVLGDEFDPDKLKHVEEERYVRERDFSRAVARDAARNEIEHRVKRAAAALDYISPEVERFYFGKAREYQATGILRDRPERTHDNNDVPRLDVLDLPSLPDKSTRLLAVSSCVATAWSESRRQWSWALRKPPEEDVRIPTFIVIDEAHNLIPADARGKAEAALREQFRTVVAEGRKYGLFLILASQRPDKLDPLVLSECENKAVMRLGSASVLAITQKMLGLDDVAPRLLEKCLEFEMGRALLVGRWAAKGPQLLYAAARRTIEGGRNLRDAYWAMRPERA